MVPYCMYKVCIQSVETEDVCEFSQEKKMSKEVLLISYQKFYSRRECVTRTN